MCDSNETFMCIIPKDVYVRNTMDYCFEERKKGLWKSGCSFVEKFLLSSAYNYFGTIALGLTALAEMCHLGGTYPVRGGGLVVSVKTEVVWSSLAQECCRIE